MRQPRIGDKVIDTDESWVGDLGTIVDISKEHNTVIIAFHVIRGETKRGIDLIPITYQAWEIGQRFKLIPKQTIII
jgi:hypothetical protein